MALGAFRGLSCYPVEMDEGMDEAKRSPVDREGNAPGTVPPLTPSTEEVGGWVHDLKAGATYWSTTLHELLGLEPGETSIERILQVVPEPERERVRQHMLGEGGVRRTLTRRTLGHRIKPPGGRVRVVQHTVSFDVGAQKIEGSLHDVTARVEMEQAMALLAEMPSTGRHGGFYEACARHLARLYDVQYAFVAVLSADRRTARTVAVWGGDRHLENFEYELRGTPCEDILSLRKELIPCDVARLYPRDEMLVAMGVESYFGAPLYDSNRTTIGLVSVMDVRPLEVSAWTAPVLGVFATRVAVELVREREEREARERSAAMAEELEHARRLESIGRLAGGVAHDFNNLLTIIMGNAEMLRDGPSSAEEERALLEEVLHAGQNARALTERLLACGRKELVEAQIVDLDEVLEGQRHVLQRLLGPDVTLRTTSSGGAARSALEPGQAEQILLNLAVNARDAMPDGGAFSIEIRVRAEAGQVELTFIDTGTGMTAETRSKMFEPFFTTKADGEGTGLGLATVYGIVHSAGGTIGVESQLGHGTTLRVVLPLAG